MLYKLKKNNQVSRMSDKTKISFELKKNFLKINSISPSRPSQMAFEFGAIELFPFSQN